MVNPSIPPMRNQPRRNIPPRFMVSCIRDLAVNFREVVHSVQAGESEVVTLQLRGRSEWTFIVMPVSR